MAADGRESECSLHELMMIIKYYLNSPAISSAEQGLVCGVPNETLALMRFSE